MKITYYLSKITPFKASLLYWNNEIFEKGFIQKWASDVIPRKNYSMIQEESDLILRMDNFKPVFIIMILGYSLAIVVFLLELSYTALENRCSFANHKKIAGCFKNA